MCCREGSRPNQGFQSRYKHCRGFGRHYVNARAGTSLTRRGKLAEKKKGTKQCGLSTLCCYEGGRPNQGVQSRIQLSRVRTTLSGWGREGLAPPPPSDHTFHEERRAENEFNIYRAIYFFQRNFTPKISRIESSSSTLPSHPEHRRRFSAVNANAHSSYGS
jgi:hypothetical protein